MNHSPAATIAVPAAPSPSGFGSRASPGSRSSSWPPWLLAVFANVIAPHDPEVGTLG